MVTTALVIMGGIALANAALPHFPPTWDMQRSTMVMPCNYSGILDMGSSVGKFGVVDIDWSNMKKIWANAHPMDAEELLVDQAKRRKAAACPDTCPYPSGCPDKNACPQAKTWVYRNLVKAFSYVLYALLHTVPDPEYARVHWLVGLGVLHNLPAHSGGITACCFGFMLTCTQHTFYFLSQVVYLCPRKA